MPTQDILLSLKFNNYNYAPGIATYGIDGKTGQPGIDGNNIYFTDCNLLIDTGEDLKILAELIANNYLPVKGSTTQINRSYKNNDLFFDYNGIIYQLTNIDNLIVNKDVGGIYSDYFNIAGKFNIADISNVFAWVGDRMILNTSTYGGYDIATINNPENVSLYISKDAVVNIISDKVNENSNIEMIKLQSIDDVDIEDGNLSVYYKTTENAFYLDSNKPIVINGDIKLNNENNTNNEYDNFSTVLTSNDTVTYFKHICDKLRYNVLYDSDVNRYKLIIYLEDGEIDKLEYLVNRSETVYGKVYDGENNLQLLKLSNIINGPTSSSNYYDFIANPLPSYSIRPINSFAFNVYKEEHGRLVPELQITVNNTYININMQESIIYKNALNIDISTNIPKNIFSIRDHDINKFFNNDLFAVNIDLILIFTNDNRTYNILLNNNPNNDQIVNGNGNLLYFNKKQSFYKDLNSNNIYKFTFDSNISNELKISVYPIITDSSLGILYQCGINKSPIEIIFRYNELLNGLYTLYFTLDYSKEKFSIKNIMLFDKDNLDKQYSTEEKPCIVSYLPNSIESVQKFSLLHNTEVFINYQE